MKITATTFIKARSTTPMGVLREDKTNMTGSDTRHGNYLYSSNTSHKMGMEPG